MSAKAIVLDANILIRAVLGKRVRSLIHENAAAVKFFAPDVAYADARKYLPALLKNGVLMPMQRCSCSMAWSAWFSPSMQSFTQACSSRRCSGSPFVMQTTGRCWPAP